MKPYIDYNTTKRAAVKNTFEKNIFRKTMENIRKHHYVEQVNDEKKLVKLTSKPTFVSCKTFNKDLIAVHVKKPVVKLD